MTIEREHIGANAYEALERLEPIEGKAKNVFLETCRQRYNTMIDFFKTGKFTTSNQACKFLDRKVNQYTKELDGINSKKQLDKGDEKIVDKMNVTIGNITLAMEKVKKGTKSRRKLLVDVKNMQDKITEISTKIKTPAVATPAAGLSTPAVATSAAAHERHITVLPTARPVVTPATPTPATPTPATPTPATPRGGKRVEKREEKAAVLPEIVVTPPTPRGGKRVEKREETVTTLKTPLTVVEGEKKTHKETKTTLKSPLTVAEGETIVEGVATLTTRAAASKLWSKGLGAIKTAVPEEQPKSSRKASVRPAALPQKAPEPRIVTPPALHAKAKELPSDLEAKASVKPTPGKSKSAQKKRGERPAGVLEQQKQTYQALNTLINQAKRFTYTVEEDTLGFGHFIDSKKKLSDERLDDLRDKVAAFLKHPTASSAADLDVNDAIELIETAFSDAEQEIPTALQNSIDELRKSIGK